MKINELKERSLDELDFSVVDVETTGMSPEFNKIIDIGIVKVKNRKIVGTWETLIDPQQELDPWITYYTSIRSNHLTGKPLFDEVSDKINELLSGNIFVAHNVGFDFSFLDKEMKLINKILDNPRLCTVKLSKRFVPELDNYNLDAVSGYFNIDITQRHRALPDAYATAKILINYLQKAKNDYQVRNFFDLERLQWNIKHENDTGTERLFENEYLT
jgi:DNA polymerase-3 subunit epsilon